jgi:hypothetical protein
MKNNMQKLTSHVSIGHLLVKCMITCSGFASHGFIKTQFFASPNHYTRRG